MLSEAGGVGCAAVGSNPDTSSGLGPEHPIYDGAEPVDLNEERLDLGSAPEVHFGSGASGFQSWDDVCGALTAGVASEAGHTAAVALQLLSLCAHRRDEALVRLQDATDRLQHFSMVSWQRAVPAAPGDVDGKRATVLQMWAVKQAHREAEVAHSEFEHYDRQVDKARARLRGCWATARVQRDGSAARKLQAERDAAMSHLLRMDVRERGVSRQSQPESEMSPASDCSRQTSQTSFSRQPQLRPRPSKAPGGTAPDPANKHLQTAVAGMVRVQAVWRAALVRPRFRRVLAAKRKAQLVKLAQWTSLWRKMTRAASHDRLTTSRKTFAALLGYANIRALRRVFGVEKLVNCCQERTLRRIVVMWFRYVVYTQAPVDKRTGIRLRKFDKPFPMWDEWVAEDARERQIRDRVAMLSVGEQLLTVLRRWKMYTYRRRLKRDRYVLARAHRDYVMVRRHFLPWRFTVVNKQQLLARARATKQYFLHRWREFIRDRHVRAYCLRCMEKVKAMKCFVVWRRKHDQVQVMRIAGRFRLLFHRPQALYTLAVLQGDRAQAGLISHWNRWRKLVVHRRLFRVFVAEHWVERSAQLKRAVLLGWLHAVAGGKRKGQGKARPLVVPTLFPQCDASTLRERLTSIRSQDASVHNQKHIHACAKELEDRCRAHYGELGTREMRKASGLAPGLSPLETEFHSEVGLQPHTQVTRMIRMHDFNYKQWWEHTRCGDPLLFVKIVNLACWMEYEAWNGVGIPDAEKSPDVDVLLDPLLVAHSQRVKAEQQRRGWDRLHDSDDEETADEKRRRTRKDRRMFLIERGKVLLASLGAPFFDRQTGTVNVHACHSFFEQERRRYYVLVMEKRKREEVTLKKFSAQMAALRLNCYNPRFTVADVRSPLGNASVVMIPVSRKAGPKGKKGPKYTETAAVSRQDRLRIPALALLVRKHYSSIVDARAHYNIEEHTILRLRAACLLRMFEFQMRQLPQVAHAVLDSRSHRIGRMERLQFETAFQRSEHIRTRFDKVSSHWRGSPNVQTRAAGQPFSILNLVGFNPSLIKSGKAVRAAEPDAGVSAAQARERVLALERKKAKAERIQRALVQSSRTLTRSASLLSSARAGVDDAGGIARKGGFADQQPGSPLLQRRWTLGSTWDAVFGRERVLSPSKSRPPPAPPPKPVDTRDYDDVDKELDRELRREQEEESKRLQEVRRRAEKEAEEGRIRDQQEKARRAHEEEAMNKLEEERRKAAEAEQARLDEERRQAEEERARREQERIEAERRDRWRKREEDERRKSVSDAEDDPFDASPLTTSPGMDGKGRRPSLQAQVGLPELSPLPSPHVHSASGVSSPAPQGDKKKRRGRRRSRSGRRSSRRRRRRSRRGSRAKQLPDAAVSESTGSDEESAESDEVGEPVPDTVPAAPSGVESVPSPVHHKPVADGGSAEPDAAGDEGAGEDVKRPEEQEEVPEPEQAPEPPPAGDQASTPRDSRDAGSQPEEEPDHATAPATPRDDAAERLSDGPDPDGRGLAQRLCLDMQGPDGEPLSWALGSRVPAAPDGEPLVCSSCGASVAEDPRGFGWTGYSYICCVMCMQDPESDESMSAVATPEQLPAEVPVRVPTGTEEPSEAADDAAVRQGTVSPEMRPVSSSAVSTPPQAAALVQDTHESPPAVQLELPDATVLAIPVPPVEHVHPQLPPIASVGDVPISALSEVQSIQIGTPGSAPGPPAYPDASPMEEPQVLGGGGEPSEASTELFQAAHQLAIRRRMHMDALTAEAKVKKQKLDERLAWRTQHYRHLLTPTFRAEAEKINKAARRDGAPKGGSSGVATAASVLLRLSSRYSRLLNAETRDSLLNLQRCVYPALLAAHDASTSLDTVNGEMDELLKQSEHAARRIQRLQAQEKRKSPERGAAPAVTSARRVRRSQDGKQGPVRIPAPRQAPQLPVARYEMPARPQIQSPLKSSQKAPSAVQSAAGSGPRSPAAKATLAVKQAAPSPSPRASPVPSAVATVPWSRPPSPVESPKRPRRVRRDRGRAADRQEALAAVKARRRGPAGPMADSEPSPAPPSRPRPPSADRPRVQEAASPASTASPSPKSPPPRVQSAGRAAPSPARGAALRQRLGAALRDGRQGPVDPDGESEWRAWITPLVKNPGEASREELQVRKDLLVRQLRRAAALRDAAAADSAAAAREARGHSDRIVVICQRRLAEVTSALAHSRMPPAPSPPPPEPIKREESPVRPVSVPPPDVTKAVRRPGTEDIPVSGWSVEAHGRRRPHSATRSSFAASAAAPAEQEREPTTTPASAPKRGYLYRVPSAQVEPPRQLSLQVLRTHAIAASRRGDPAEHFAQCLRAIRRAVQNQPSALPQIALPPDGSEATVAGMIADSFLAGRGRAAVTLLRRARATLPANSQVWWLSAEVPEASELLWRWFAGIRGACLQPSPPHPEPPVRDVLTETGESRSVALAKLLGQQRRERQAQGPAEAVTLQGQRFVPSSRGAAAAHPRPRTAEPPQQCPPLASRPRSGGSRHSGRSLCPEEVGRLVEAIAAAPRQSRKVQPLELREDD